MSFIAVPAFEMLVPAVERPVFTAVPAFEAVSFIAVPAAENFCPTAVPVADNLSPRSDAVFLIAAAVTFF